MRRLYFPFVAVGLSLLLGCATAPPTPTADQYFADTKKSLVAMDYEAALKNLDRLIKAAGNEPLGQEGKLIRAALLISMAEGTKQMADAYNTGSKQAAARFQYNDFVKMKSDYYGVSRTRLMSAMEAILAQRKEISGKPMPLSMPFPQFSGVENVTVAQIKTGRWVPDADRVRAELDTVNNAFAYTLARWVGAGENVHKGHELFEKGAVQIDPRVYLIETSSHFMKLSEIFGRMALDEPRYRSICHDVITGSLETLAKLLEAAPDKDLEARRKKMKAECDKRAKELGL